MNGSILRPYWPFCKLCLSNFCYLDKFSNVNNKNASFTCKITEFWQIYSFYQMIHRFYDTIKAFIMPTSVADGV
ncbi:hypothetical protein B0681_05280 [Moraxella porci DSM 25326]|uniref:Uncharacterized protein n=1 Tax=Moraxella porci DSM 25326 TaxID=573983 RepID=A0A1T0CSU9_9GAMM|nr:hypothetical protein B0681_05280 [Moraxella porci DSM 25326]